MVAPMRSYGRDQFYWVWSKNGPMENTRIFDHLVIDGRVQWPLTGDQALEMEGLGYRTAPALPDHIFQEWTQVDGSWVPVFAKAVIPKKRGRPPKAEVVVD